jgi:hypothetical protein
MQFVEIRKYRSDDLAACRDLYAQLVEHHREIYDDPTIGGDDPGAGFDEYLSLPERVLTWVAIEDGVVVGLTGLLWEGEESTSSRSSSIAVVAGAASAASSSRPRSKNRVGAGRLTSTSSQSPATPRRFKPSTSWASERSVTCSCS